MFLSVLSVKTLQPEWMEEFFLFLTEMSQTYQGLSEDMSTTEMAVCSDSSSLK